MDIKVIHLSNDYSGSSVYKNLFSQFDDIGIEQVVYCPVRSRELLGKNAVHLNNPESQIIYSHVLSLYTRINYFAKIRRIFDDVVSKIDVRHFDVIHAHTWYSDGGVALKLYQEFQIPYIVTIRGTDYNLFFKKLVYLRQRGLEILRNAKRIVFISPSYKKKLFSSSFYIKHKSQLGSSSQVIPNGIDNFWIVNRVLKRRKARVPIQLLYIGRFIKGKNLPRLIEAVKVLNYSGIPCVLNLVGGGGSDHDKIIKLIANSPLFIYHGQVYDKPVLKEIFARCDVFTMPSMRETFGLVYIEALSQGIPLVYSIDEGIYGYFDSSIGEAVDPTDLQSIVDGISRVCQNYHLYDFDPGAIANKYNWRKIADSYLSIYR